MHISAVEKAGLSSLNEGAKVSYEEVANRGKTSAENLRVGLNSLPAPADILAERAFDHGRPVSWARQSRRATFEPWHGLC
jgi:'Cold-shock' DNA-binding domain